MDAPSVAKGPLFLQVENKDWSDCADVQTDLNLSCTQGISWGRLGQNSCPKGLNFALYGTQG